MPTAVRRRGAWVERHHSATLRRLSPQTPETPGIGQKLTSRSAGRSNVRGPRKRIAFALRTLWKKPANGLQIGAYIVQTGRLPPRDPDKRQYPLLIYWLRCDSSKGSVHCVRPVSKPRKMAVTKREFRGGLLWRPFLDKQLIQS
jgi:hypothetical protein